MGQKVNPNGLRLNINRDWSAKWYASKNDYAKFLHQDLLLREYLYAKLKTAGVSDIVIKRTYSELNIRIFASRVGIILGQEGQNLPKLILGIRKVLHERKQKIHINVIETRRAELDANLVAQNIARQLENRGSFRRVQKIAMRKALLAGAKGIKTQVAGRLNGADMARTEGYSEGIVPLTTLRAHIDYAKATASTTYGAIGVKVWICLADNYKQRDASARKNDRRNNNRSFRNNRNSKSDFNSRSREGATGRTRRPANSQQKPFTKSNTGGNA